MTEQQSLAGPIDSSERSILLDALRGWALLGILTVNMAGFIGFFFLSNEQQARTLFGSLNGGANFILEWLLIGKFYSIFSLLFGIGFAIQLRRLEQRGEGVARYLRRLAVLFLIGLAHIFILWFGDIVALYALMGAVLLLFRGISDRWLLRWAMLFWLVPVGWSALIHFGGFNAADPIYDSAFRTLAEWGFEDENPLVDYRETGFIAALALRPGESLFRLGDLIYQMRFTKVLGMFLIGLWVGRRAVYANLDANAPLLRKVAIWGFLVGFPLSLVKAILTTGATREQPVVQFLTEVAYVLSTPTLALGYAALFALAWLSGRTRLLDLAAPAGRMALTNYLMQTVIQGFFFLGWGLALIGQLGLIFIYPLSAALFAFQIAYSRWWLARFRFGPVEWLWRSLTYGRAQPMRLATA